MKRLLVLLVILLLLIGACAIRPSQAEVYARADPAKQEYLYLLAHGGWDMWTRADHRETCKRYRKWPAPTVAYQGRALLGTKYQWFNQTDITAAITRFLEEKCR